ncbi:MAG TPA: class I SAM-dependent methyltransferase [Acetobacteraceae bacterium]|jgi:SAM-dependent methyltransferase
MAQWDHGYVTDVTYTTNFYREITPIWLATTALLLGQRPPDLTRPFRYADLGCGHGFTTLVVAATCPEAEIWGFDFNPAHIEWATRLAGMAGLSNVHFVETSFADLAARPPADLPAFDFIVSHGVLSWISPENQRLLHEVIRQRLKPGGLAYVSYNVTTGWGAMLPVRTLMRLLTEASPLRTDLSSGETLDFVARVKDAGALLFPNNPWLETRLADMRRHDPRYIAHEYLNRDWHPIMFADVADAMAEAKCAYVGSATLTDNIDALSVPSAMVPLLGETRDLRLRETLRDVGAAQSFRRDLYRRGLAPLPLAEQRDLVDAVQLAWVGQPMPDPITFSTPLGSVTGKPEVYQPLLDGLRQGPLSVRAAYALAPFADAPLVELLQAFILLTAGNHAHPVAPGGDSAAARQGAQALNRAIAALNAAGGDVPRLAAPAIGSSLQVDLLDTLVLGALQSGQPADADGLAAYVLATLDRCGRSLQRDGQPVADAAETRSLAQERVRTTLVDRLPVFRALGILETAG